MSPSARFRLLALGAAGLASAAACERKPVVETEPVPLNEFAFQYPEELWDAGVEGKTVLRIHINTGGTVDSARVETPSRHAAFDSAAIAGTTALRFEPAKRDGTPVSKWVLLPVEFEIKEPGSAAADSATNAQTQ
ncbi:energy transducer TonB [Longimicrobium sp.]|uniref:energy transducer TonB family protein n=1 Tax=Longimicrobium sp. TaxID=2029185 RepID=UPI002E359C6A|nr:energy transducer TonB [Longimicrobium sp.]HEX6036930.1 energy transducer TonB [Longimicrobium sp.]